MNERVMFALLLDLWQDVSNPAFLWQLLALLACLLLAWVLARYGRRHELTQVSETHGALRAFGAGSLRRLFFPLLALLFVVIARKAFKIWHLGPVSLLDVAIPLMTSMALVRVVIYFLRYAFSPSGWLVSSERFVASTIWFGLALHLSGLAEPLIEFLEQITLHIGKQKLDLWTLLNGLVTVIATAVIALWLAGLIERRLLASETLDSNLRVVLGRLVKAVLSVIALLLSLSLVGIDITALSVFSGALAVGLGLGLQKIASNYVSGFILLLDRSIRIGNVIAVDPATSGVVSQITVRYTVVRTLTGIEVIIPNEYLVSNIIRNESFSDSRIRLSISVQVAYDADLERAMQLMVAAAAEQPRVLDDPAPQAQLTMFADSGINLDLVFWINDPQAGSGGVRSAINLAIWRAFKENGIEIPFQQREVRILGGLPKAAGPADLASATISAAAGR
ncbi:MAG TPA: mechanosensitive ion channel [Accumulibacter sp.]|nr:mechanosensitive ion channel [Accumulibacter sp.]HMW17478.1 mechanosensitive ion channel [Accumulibacter sp.]HMX21695.1 mechanosensitive ion channel [Accumulibacter sp.]HMY07729.1 mechanosensitive ion channel [Accumulibacter sp.]HNC17786.1 mechanosensitive ion channel [Accumulibacter sp.]